MTNGTPLSVSLMRNLHNSRVYILADAPASADYSFQQCLLSERMSPEEKHPVPLSKEILSNYPNISLRNDLIDTTIEICTPEVPALFTENFDYDDLRTDFVNGILTSDIISKRVYCYIPASGYARGITSWEEYWKMSCDVVNGVTAPFDPGMNLERDQTFSKKVGGWREKEVRVEKSATLQKTAIGSQTTIAEKANITKSVIGRNCRVAADVTIENSVLWSNASVSAGALIQNSIVLEGCTIEGKVGEMLVISANSPIPPFGARKSFIKPGEEDSDSEIEDIVIGTSLKTTLTLANLNLSDSSISDIDSDEDNDESRRHRTSSSLSGTETSQEEFYVEARDSLQRAFKENHSIENATIELKTLRMATNVTFHEVRAATVAALMDLLLTSPTKVPPMFAKWGELLLEFTEEEDQSDVVLLVQRYFVGKVREGVRPQKFALALQALYQADVLEEETILSWYDSKPARGVGEKWAHDMHSLRNAAEKFIIWLKETEEETDEE
jgi:translation initiation factor eIF-2B subunit epsilon